MSITLLNSVWETTATTGTGAYLLAGVYNASWRPVGDVGDGALVPLRIDNGSNKSEWGLYTYNAGPNTLTRTTILGNHLGTTAAINWTAGTKNVYSPDLKEFLSWITFNNSANVSALKLAESSVPETPATGFVSLYAKSDGLLYSKDDTGTETQLNNGAGGQPLDDTLTAFAALTITANSLTIGTGTDSFLQTEFAANTFPARGSAGNLMAKPISNFGFLLVAGTNAALIRTMLGIDSDDYVTFGSVTVGEAVLPDEPSGATLGDSSHWFSQLWTSNIFGNPNVGQDLNLSSSDTGSIWLNYGGGNVKIGGGVPSASELHFHEADGPHYVGLVSPVLSATTLYTLPNAFPASNGMSLVATTGGAMSWAAVATSIEESPVGTINGSNVAFTLSQVPATNSLLLFLNGVHQYRNAGGAYTLSGDTITFNAGCAPPTGSTLVANYRV